MSRKILRGRVLNFLSEPKDPDDTASYSYVQEGGILMDGGIIAACGDYPEIRGQAPDAEVTDHRPHLLMAGFIDTHLHFPQTQVIGSWGAKLLDWLNTYTFPEEGRYGDEQFARHMASRFFDELLNNGTTTTMAYCSVHKASADAYFSEAEARNLRVIGGKVLMDRNAPDAVRDTPQSGYDDTKALIAQWHGRGRAHYAVTPRFAITSSPEQMETAQALVGEHPDCYVQTHLSENHEEIAMTGELYPQARDYLDIYQSYGLLGPKMFLGHCIHLKAREISALAETGSHPVFCPTSNLFLGSGLFDDAGLRGRGIENAIATDIGGGTSYSMLQTLNEGYKVLQLQNQNLHPFRAFYWITHGNAAALGLDDKIGTLEGGTEADIVVLNSAATNAMALRMERAKTLAEELFVLQIMGDDRAIAQTYAAGEPMKTP